MILSVGKAESTVVASGSTRRSIEDHLGAPVEIVRLDPPIPFEDFQDFPRQGVPFEEVAVRQIVPAEASSHPTVAPIPPAVTCRAYRYTGRVAGKHDAGEAASLAGFTGGLSEIVTVPAAIAEQSRRGDVTHTVFVWFDALENALGYLWIRDRGLGMTPPDRVPKALGGESACHLRPR